MARLFDDTTPEAEAVLIALLRDMPAAREDEDGRGAQRHRAPAGVRYCAANQAATTRARPTASGASPDTTSVRSIPVL